MAIEIVELPINSMVIFHSYVSLPEGIFAGQLRLAMPIIRIWSGNDWDMLFH